jgi:hypothetical protein
MLMKSFVDKASGLSVDTFVAVLIGAKAADIDAQ